MGCGSSSPSPERSSVNPNNNRASSSNRDRDELERKIEEENRRRREEDERLRNEEEERYARLREAENKNEREDDDDDDVGERRAIEEAERIAREAEARRAREEEERRKRAEEEKRAREEEERRAKEEEEKRAIAEAEAMKEDEEERRAIAEAEAMKEDEEERRAIAEAEAMKEDEEERRAIAEAEAMKEEEERRRAIAEAEAMKEEAEIIAREMEGAGDDADDHDLLDAEDVEGSEGYERNSVGLMIKTVDTVKHFHEEDNDLRPRVEDGQLYTDHEFPLQIAIVQDNSSIEWKRPGEFLEDPKLFTEGTTRYDIGQGSAGTCWFLSTVAVIADDERLLKQILPDDAYSIETPDTYDGVFHARFYRFGQWEDVYIDDYLPVIYSKVLWGAKSATDVNELWVALLEKAFAKLHGSYDVIYGGQPGDAYLLLTGGIGERIELEDHNDKASVLYRRITNALNSGCSVTCVVPDEFDDYMGLVGGHAYSLVATTKIGNTKLIRVRNPWGHGEWKGPWSDGSDEWALLPDKTNAPNKDDGEFFVSLPDFMTYFSQTTICSLTPDFDQDGCLDALNYVLSLFGEWHGQSAAGFQKLLSNPRYVFTIGEEGMMDDGCVPFVVQLIQRSDKRIKDNISIRCDVFKVLGDKVTPDGHNIAVEIQGKRTNVYTPELQSSFRHRLKPGKYILIPSAIEEGQEKAFILRLFTAGPLKNVREISAETNMLSCENESTIDIGGDIRPLTFVRTLIHGFISNRNAGGQVSNRDTYASNPQYLITIPDTGAHIPLVIHIMQVQKEPQYPIGIRLFHVTERTVPPVDVNYLYDHYNNSPTDMDGSQSKFVISWDVDTHYLLPAGRYIALVHMDKPNTEKTFSIVFKSTTNIQIKGFQTS